MSNLEIDQPQTCFNKSLNYEPQLELMSYIFNWARQLPASPQGIIDLAAGYGIEAKELILNGFPCQAQDADLRMANNALVKVNLGYAESLSHYPPETFGGALLKDTLIALSPQQRIKMLEGLNNILVPNGSLLVSSEILTKYEIRYQTPGVHGCCNYNCLLDDLRLLNSFHQKLIRENATIGLISYKSTSMDLKTQAVSSGFKYELIQEYSDTHPLALENRWIQTAGFIAKLTKTS